MQVPTVLYSALPMMDLVFMSELVKVGPVKQSGYLKWTLGLWWFNYVPTVMLVIQYI